MKKRKIFGLTAVAIVITLVFTVIVPYTYATTSKSDIDSLQSQQSSLSSQLSSLSKDLDTLKKDKQQQQAVKQNYDQQTQIIQAQINNLTSQIDDLNSSITDKDTLITNLTADYTQNLGEFKQIMRASYMMGDAPLTEVLLGGNDSDVYELLAKYQIVESIDEHENSLITNMKSDLSNEETAKTAIVQTRDQVSAAKSQIDAKKAQNTKLINDATAYINSLTQDANSKQSLINQYTSELNAVNAKINSIVSTGAFVGGTFAWPVPSFYTITSPFGMRTNPITHLYSLHTGIDISGGGVLGKPIIAANNGVVKLANNTTDGAYGRYVLVDHGGGFMTFYGHCNSIAVKVGQNVTKGQTIATVGNTGWSTGPHLHFEIRIPVKGVTTAVNPMLYYSKG